VTARLIVTTAALAVLAACSTESSDCAQPPIACSHEGELRLDRPVSLPAIVTFSSEFGDAECALDAAGRPTSGACAASTPTSVRYELRSGALVAVTWTAFAGDVRFAREVNVVVAREGELQSFVVETREVGCGGC
jgi:uncharacterized lipoprotein YajG